VTSAGTPCEVALAGLNADKDKDVELPPPPQAESAISASKDTRREDRSKQR